MAGSLKTKSALSVNTLLLMLGYSFYKSVAYNSYVTNFTLTETAYGYISELPFMFGASLGLVVAAMLIFFLSRRRIIKPLGLMYRTPLIVLASCYVLCYGASLVLDPHFNVEFVLPILGFIWGLATITLTTVWVELFTYESSPIALVGLLAMASFFSAVIAMLVRQLPQEFNVAIGIMLALVCIPIIATCRRRSALAGARTPLTQTAPVLGEARGKKGSLGNALRMASTPILAYFFFELVVGLINMFAYSGTSTFSISTTAPIEGMLICGILVVLFVFFTNRTPSPNIIYLAVFPVIISVFLILPFFGESLGSPLSSVIYAAYVFTSILTMFCYVEASRAAGADPYQVTTLVGAGVRIMLMIGLGLGYFISNHVEAETYMQLTIVVVASVYFLGIVIVLWGYLNSRNRKKRDAALAAEQAEALAQAEALVQAEALAKAEALAQAEAAIQAESRAKAEALAQAEAALQAKTAAQNERYEESISLKVQELTTTYSLTNRERDVLVGLSKGNSAARIAEDLFISTSTAQGYIKSLYAKLGVNKKQQVLDLFTRSDRQELPVELNESKS